MTMNPLPHVEFGDSAANVRARWAMFATTPGIEVITCTAGPVMHARSETEAATVVRANLLHPVWFSSGVIDDPNCPLGPLTLPRKKAVSV